MANKKCIYTDLNTVQILSQSSPAYITVNKVGDIGQEVWVYQKEFNSTEGFVLNYLGEDSFMEYASQLTELIDNMARIDLGITKTAIDNTLINFNIQSTYNSNNTSNNGIVKDYIQTEGISKFNCVNIEPCNSTQLDFTFKTPSSQTITSFITNSERIHKDGIRQTNYTPIPATGHILMGIAPTSQETLLADFNILSTSTLANLTSTGWATLSSTGWTT